MIEQGAKVFALVKQEQENLSIRGNLREVAARGANTCIISLKGLDGVDDRFVTTESKSSACIATVMLIMRNLVKSVVKLRCLTPVRYLKEFFMLKKKFTSTLMFYKYQEKESFMVCSFQVL